jgi:hypothetical protein
MDYLIDANCFIESKNVTNPLDVAISFWAKIKDLALAGRIHSIDKVKTEIPASFFYSTSAADVQQNVADLRSWAVGTGLYDNKAIQDFNSSTVADPYLAGYAATDSQNIKVVTNEKAGTGSKHSVKLPDACAQKGVSCLRIMEMLREMGETF